MYIHKVGTALREHYIYTMIKTTGICTKHKWLQKNNHRIQNHNENITITQKLMVAPLTTSATRRLKYNLCDKVGGGRKSSFQQNTMMTRVVPAAAVAMKMEWDKDVEYPPETASRWLSCVRESLTIIYFTPNMLEWYWIVVLANISYCTTTATTTWVNLCHIF